MSCNRYEGKCGSCKNFYECDRWFNIIGPYNIDNTDQGYCDYPTIKAFFYPDSPACSHYELRDSYSSSCFITTVVCHILGYDDDCFALESLRSLRDDFMQPNEECKKDLFEYDTVGPQIAKILTDDFINTEDKTVAQALYLNYILPASIEASQDKPNNAITIYKKMTNMLKETYNIKTKEELLQEYDQSKGGHGDFKVLKKETRNI